MQTSSRPSPAGDMSFNRLHQEGFDHQHDGNESERISENSGDVEELKGTPDLEADSVGPAQEFDDQNDLPDKR